MAIKFLQEKERQETLIYIAVFVAIFAGLIHFVGVNFDFKEPEVVLEGRENFLEIKETLEQIESQYDFARSRTFTLIPPFGDRPGRSNPFQAEGMGGIVDIETEGREDDLFEVPETVTEPVTEPVTEEEEEDIIAD